VNAVLFSRGADFVVYVDGNNLGVVRRTDCSISTATDRLLGLIREAGEEGEWFVHPAGFLVARGTRKAPARTPSRLTAKQIADAVANGGEADEKK